MVLSAGTLALAGTMIYLGLMADWPGRYRLLLGVGAFGVRSVIRLPTPDFTLLVADRVGEGIAVIRPMRQVGSRRIQ